ncbi:hypothetical protein [Stigmatella erecta]|uniref:hypothetical protein n=1 Tax=Stigmatella erecta TaxID=83460 RepID=UPI001160298F|nr:hypothetical protein [Stigmatella erecta]
MASAEDRPVRELIEEHILRNTIHAQGFEQVIASSVSRLDQLPRSGLLESEYLTFLSDSIRMRNAFKLVTWALCVSPQSEAGGNVLIVDSIRGLPGEKRPATVEVLYRSVRKTASPPSATPVWPYAVVVLRGWHEKIVCRPMEG